MNRLAAVLFVASCASRPRPMALQKVTLYQNGIGYFERSGHLSGGKLHLELARPELDDVLKTLTVIDKLGAAVATVDVPHARDTDRTIGLDVRLSAGRAHDLLVSYAVPTPTWKAAYRVVLDDRSPTALLQAWAMVNNASQEDWRGVQLTLATGAPMSFALDLHTPEYVKRPDAAGHLIAPTVLGPVDGEQVGASETVNGLVDRDGDGLVDKDDKCPDDAAGDGMDGCPVGRGRVIVSESSIMILERITFAPGSDVLAPATIAIVDATAATLKGNPDIARVEIGGHASSDEREAWGLASRRAAAVRTALIQRGIAADRLVLQPYGATQPIDVNEPAKNRRVEFLILSRADAARDPRGTRLDVSTARASTTTHTRPAAVAGSVRYVVGEPIDVPRGGSAMVSIINKPITGEDVMLWRPDGNAPGSDRHPFRAVRIVNSSGFTLEPGPIAIFAHGTFVGDTLLQRLQIAETAWIPYALDGGTQVISEALTDERPVRIVAIHKGVLSVENAGVRVTKYAIATGADPTKVLYIRHAKAAGYVAQDLPPGTQDRGDAYLIPVPLVAAKASTLTVEEREPRHRALALVDARPGDLAIYVEGSHLPAGLADKLAVAIGLRKEAATLEEHIAVSRAGIADVSGRAAELRDSLRTLDKVRGADDLRKKLIASLAAATADADTHARELGQLGEELAAARGRLADAIRELTLEP